MTTTRSATEIWLIGNSISYLNTSCLPTNGDVMRYFFHIFKNQNATTNDAVKRTIEAVTEIWLKSGIPMKSSWLHSKQLLKIFESWKFCESLETLFDLAAENAEQQISGDRLRTEKARKEDVAFLHDQRNARKMQMSTLDHESRAKWQRKRQRVETENLKITQALSSKTGKPTANPISLQDSSSHSESETSGEEFSPCSSKRIHASNQTVSVQLPRKILQSKTLTQVADRECLSKSLLLCRCFHD